MYLPPFGKLQISANWWHISSLPLAKTRPSDTDLTSYCDVKANMSLAARENYKMLVNWRQALMPRNAGNCGFGKFSEISSVRHHAYYVHYLCDRFGDISEDSDLARFRQICQKPSFLPAFLYCPFGKNRWPDTVGVSLAEIEAFLRVREKCLIYSLNPCNFPLF